MTFKSILKSPSTILTLVLNCIFMSYTWLLFNLQNLPDVFMTFINNYWKHVYSIYHKIGVYISVIFIISQDSQVYLKGYYNLYDFIYGWISMPLCTQFYCSVEMFSGFHNKWMRNIVSKIIDHYDGLIALIHWLVKVWQLQLNNFMFWAI